METNYIKWNIPNWITVVLMVGLAWFAFGFASSAYRQYAGG